MEQSEIFASLSLKFPQAIYEELTQAVIVPKDSLLDVASYLKSGELAFNNLHCLTAADRKDRLELIYIFFSLKGRCQVILKVYLSLDNLEVESLTKFYRSADWFEREVYDLFGVKFLNHPDLARILNPDDWKGYPLRKDYRHPDIIKKPQY